MDNITDDELGWRSVETRLAEGYDALYIALHMVLELIIAIPQHGSQYLTCAWEWLCLVVTRGSYWWWGICQYLHDAYTLQMGQTPLTVKTCLMMSFLIILISVVLRIRRNKKYSDTTSTSDVSILSVFDLAKTAYEPGHVDSLIDLIKKRQFDINYPLPKSGLSLFLCACVSGQRKLIKYLLEKGARCDQTTHDGDSPLYLATFGVMSQASKHEAVDIITDLIAAGCDVNRQNKKGFTALHRAASKGNIPVIVCLLKHGASPYLKTLTGIFPIDLATNSGHHEAAELLEIQLSDKSVWDVVEPHTPSRAKLGLMSPRRQHLAGSITQQSRSVVSVITRSSVITHT